MAALFPELIVNGERIPVDVIAAEAQYHEAPKGKPGIAWRKAANAVAIRTLLLQEAKRRGLVPDSQELTPGRFETNEEALIRSLIENAVDVVKPDTEDVRAEWVRDPSRFRAPPLWEVSHILIACDPRNADETVASQERAKMLSAQIDTAPLSFAKIARDHSDCESKLSDGFLGQISPGDTVPEFEAALRNLVEGEITPDPVLTRHGWHIIRLDAVAEGAALPFNVVRPKLADAMEKAAWTQAARDFVDHLVAAADIDGADLKPL